MPRTMPNDKDEDELARGIRAIMQNLEHELNLAEMADSEKLLSATRPSTSIWPPSLPRCPQQQFQPNIQQCISTYSQQYYLPPIRPAVSVAPTVPIIPASAMHQSQISNLSGYAKQAQMIRSNMFIPPIHPVPVQRGLQPPQPTAQPTQYQVRHRASNMRRRYWDRFCAFCFNNNDMADASNHFCRDEMNRVTCPKLFLLVCPKCGSTGEFAHTIRYCPYRFVATPEDTEKIEQLKRRM